MSNKIEMSSFIDESSRKAIQQALQLEGLHVGRHIIRNTQRSKVAEIYARKLYVGEIRPPTAPPVFLAMLMDDRQVQHLLYFSNQHESFVVGPISRQPDWPDPIAESLTGIDLWSVGKGIPFGGFSYKLLIYTTHLQAVIELGRATHSHHRAIASRMFEISTSIGSESQNPIVATFLDQWRQEIGLL